jgi:hypothetical protein
VGTQFDALPHIAIGDLFYNCIKLDDVATRTGFTKLGVEKVGALFTRGVLLDIAAFRGVEMLEAGYEITGGDVSSLTSPHRRGERECGRGGGSLPVFARLSASRANHGGFGDSPQRRGGL